MEDVKFCAGAAPQSAGGISSLSLLVQRILRATTVLEKSNTFPPRLAGTLNLMESTSFTPRIFLKKYSSFISYSKYEVHNFFYKSIVITYQIPDDILHKLYLPNDCHKWARQNWNQSILVQLHCCHQPLRCWPFQGQIKTKLLTNQMPLIYRLYLVVPKAHNLLLSTLGQ